MSPPISTVVVGYGLAGRSIHVPLILRQPGLKLQGVVARDAGVRAQAVSELGVKGFANLDEALADPGSELVVIATPHDTHAELVERTLDAGRHCVVDKVMALSEAEADRMIAARDRSGRMLSVFHNRRWDWDYATVKAVVRDGRIGRPRLVESSVCRYAPPRTWRGRTGKAGTILHDWGAHLIDQALQLGLGPCRRVSCWIIPAPWPGVDSGGHGRIVLEFDDVLFQVENSRITRLDRPRWWIIGSEGGLVKYGIDPQEDALRAGRLDHAVEPPEHQARLRQPGDLGQTEETVIETHRASWDSYYANIVDYLDGRAPLEVTAEQAREVVRVLDAATQSAREHRPIEGRWEASPS